MKQKLDNSRRKHANDTKIHSKLYQLYTLKVTNPLDETGLRRVTSKQWNKLNFAL